jgi:hypothetical protein
MIYQLKFEKTDCTNCEEYQFYQAHRGIAGPRGVWRFCNEMDGKLNILNQNIVDFLRKTNVKSLAKIKGNFGHGFFKFIIYFRGNYHHDSAWAPRNYAMSLQPHA